MNAVLHLALPAAAADAAPPRLAATLRAVLGRDLRVATRRRSDVAGAMLFFVIVTSLFPLGVGAEPALLRRLAPGIVWVAALLATMLSQGRLFADDWHDGCLEPLLLAAAPLPLLVLAKTTAHFLTTGLLLALAAPLIALQFDLSGAATAALVGSLLLGMPVLSLVGGIGAALTVGVRGGGLLLSLLVLPLVVPVLIFGCGAVAAVDGGQSPAGYFSLLGALLALALFLAPIATAAALRIACE